MIKTRSIDLSVLYNFVGYVFVNKMLTCTAKNCSSVENTDHVENSELFITFHKYPLFDKKLLKLWLENIAYADFEPGPDDHICSQHFTDDQFLDTKPTRLIRNAVPTIHGGETNDNTSENNTAKKKEYKENSDSSVNCEVSSDTVSGDDSEYEITDRRKRKKYFGKARYVGDFKEEDLKHPKKMKAMWMLACKQISEQKNKLRTITQRNRRLEGQVTRLKNIVKHLKSGHK